MSCFVSSSICIFILYRISYIICSYVGQWEMNKKHGKGRFEYASGRWERQTVQHAAVQYMRQQFT